MKLIFNNKKLALLENQNKILSCNTNYNLRFVNHQESELYICSVLFESKIKIMDFIEIIG